MEEKLKILLCEDDENLGMLLREYLQAKGFTATLCPDGEVGYHEFLKNKFDICVLDVMMPKKDGFTLAQEIRQANAEIPIIFLTAKTLKDDILEGFKIGADDYITKAALEPVIDLIVKAKVELAVADIKKAYDAKIIALEARIEEFGNETIRKGGQVVVIKGSDSDDEAENPFLSNLDALGD